MRSDPPSHRRKPDNPVNQENGTDELIERLHDLQQVHGWLGLNQLRQVAMELDLPPSHVFGVASFYHAFRLEPPGQNRCTVCTGTSCHIMGGTKLLHRLKERFGIRNGQTTDNGSLSIDTVRCLGKCAQAPLILTNSSEISNANTESAIDGINAMLAPAEAKGPATPVANHRADTGVAGELRIVLEQCGKIDPDRLDSALTAGAYNGLSRAVYEMTPESVCAEIAASGLRGRGGGGYPTGQKWAMVRKARGAVKYVVANGDEGDPGAFMDRTLMEQDPHRLLEGMAIAGYAVGAQQGFIYVRGEYPLAAARLRKAINEAETAGILGPNVMGSNSRFSIKVRIGAGAFVCGEETALMASIMGRRGQPRIRPPYPPEQGLWGYPTLINNVETFGSIAPIINNGAAWFSAIGVPGNSGTKVFSVSGDVARVGVYEVPLGTPFSRLLSLAGGVTGGSFKAAQTGGASGGCIPAAHMDVPLDFETLKDLGTIMGSGGVVVMNNSRCMPDLARFFMEFCHDESCGLCTPCRSGTLQAGRILERITTGTARVDDLERLEEICLLMRETSLCGLGMAAPTPVLSTLRWYRDEYLAHIRDHACPGDVCEMGGNRP